MSLSDDDFVMDDSQQSNEADRRLVVRFSLQPRLDQVKTAEEGRDIFKDVTFVTILIPGDKSLTVHRPILPSDKARFPTQYRAFLNKQGEVMTGTPLAGWPLINDNQRRELDYVNVRTVEQLADLSDGYVSNMMGVQQLKAAAQRYIASAKDKAPMIKMEKELQARDAQIAAMQEQINQILAAKAAPAAEQASEKKGK